MNSGKRFAALAAVIAISCATLPASGGVLTLRDVDIDWNGYEVASPDSDPSGVPIFSPTDSGSITVVGGQIQSLSIKYNNSGSSSTNNLWKYLKPGDVFIDKDANGNWDYILRTPFFDNGNYYVGGSGPLYSSTLAWEVFNVTAQDLRYDNNTDAGSYQLGQTTQTATGVAWSGIATTRQDHPWSVTDSFINALPLSALIGSINSNNPWDDLTSPANQTESIGWDLSSLSSQLGVGNQFVVSFTVNCTNDVMFSPVIDTAGGGSLPTPEPTSMAAWLLGMGVAGATSLKRIRRLGGMKTT